MGSGRLLIQAKRKLQAAVLTNPSAALPISALLSLLVYILLFVQPANLIELAPDLPLESDFLYLHRPVIQVRVVLGFMALALLYLWALWVSLHARGWISWMVVSGGAVSFALALLFMYPFGAADIFDNILHGRLLAFHGGNPFAPDHDLLSADRFYSFAAWKRAPSAYGPLWESLAALTARSAGDGVLANVFAFKLLPGVHWAASLALVAVILRRRAGAQALPGVVLLGWNPLVLYETWGNGHNDMAMVMWIILACWLVMEGSYSLATLSLVAGALVKFIPVLLLPAVVFMALRRQIGWRAKVGFLLRTSSAALFLIALSYLPFWTGAATLSVERRAMMFTTSLPAVAFKLLIPWVGEAPAGLAVSALAAMVTILVAFLLGWDGSGRADWRSFPRAAFGILMFYLLLTCTWFQGWYLTWVVGLAALLPGVRCRSTAVFFSLIVIAKYMILGPLILWQDPWPPEPQLEIVFTLGVMSLPWIYTAGCLWRARGGRRRSAPNSVRPVT